MEFSRKAFAKSLFLLASRSMCGPNAGTHLRKSCGFVDTLVTFVNRVQAVLVETAGRSGDHVATIAAKHDCRNISVMMSAQAMRLISLRKPVIVPFTTSSAAASQPAADCATSAREALNELEASFTFSIARATRVLTA